MTDIFFSYSSRDLQRVRPIRDALVEQGFAVFWDQVVPAGVDWDTWIRRHLQEARCALVFWSAQSIASDNVRHEASVAKQTGKLVPVMLETLSAEQFPMGFLAVQCAKLLDWSGDVTDGSWVGLQQQIEAKLTPRWVRNKLDALEAELVEAQSGREHTEQRERTWRKQLHKGAEAQQTLRRERDEARDDLEVAQSRLSTLEQTCSTRDAAIAELSQKLAGTERQRQQLATEAAATGKEIATLKRSIADLEKSLAQARATRPAATRISDESNIAQTAAERMPLCSHCGRSGSVSREPQVGADKSLGLFKCSDCGHTWRERNRPPDATKVSKRN